MNNKYVDYKKVRKTVKSWDGSTRVVDGFGRPVKDEVQKLVEPTTGNVTVGMSNTVHAYNPKYGVVCGAAGRGEGFSRGYDLEVKETTETIITCKRCLKARG